MDQFVSAAREFSALPEEVKEKYGRKEGEMFLGYEKGKEKFKRPDGQWFVDDLKASYYGFVPDHPENKWPHQLNLKDPFQKLGTLMSQMGKAVMEKMGMLKLSLEGTPQLGRMLYYRKSGDTVAENPFWCGAHFDHGMFTVLIPATYFEEGKQIPEPEEAGLFVKPHNGETFEKVVANDPEVMLFQVGEFGQLITDDDTRATEHRVHKASGSVERYTMALFFDAPMETVIHSFSELTADSRYGGAMGAPCSYSHWTEETFKRYIVE